MNRRGKLAPGAGPTSVVWSVIASSLAVESDRIIPVRHPEIGRVASNFASA